MEELSFLLLRIDCFLRINSGYEIGAGGFFFQRFARHQESLESLDCPDEIEDCRDRSRVGKFCVLSNFWSSEFRRSSSTAGAGK